MRVATAKKLVSLIGKNLNTLEDAVPADMFNSIVDLAAADPSCLHAADPREDVLYNTADALTAIVEDKDADRREALAKVCLTPLAKLSMNAAVHDAEASEMGIALLVQLFKGSEPSRKALKQIFFQGELAAPTDRPRGLAEQRAERREVSKINLARTHARMRGAKDRKRRDEPKP